MRVSVHVAWLLLLISLFTNCLPDSAVRQARYPGQQMVVRINLAFAVVQYSKYGSPVHKVEILAGLADNCELAPSGGKQLLEQAAVYRQKLFAEMVAQKLTVPKRCAECHKKTHAHKASEAKGGQNSKIVAASCGHLFHKGCLQTLYEESGCPTCAEPLLVLIRTVKAAQ